MPELPEVEILKRQLEKTVVGKKIAQVEVLRKKSFQGSVKQIIGKKIIGVERRAKILIIKLSQGYLLVHLKLTGQLIYQRKGSRQKLKHLGGQERIVGGHPTLDWISKLPSKHTRVIISFSDGSKLYFNDLRVFGWIKAISKIKDQKETNLKTIDQVLKLKLGPEPFDKKFTVKYLKDIFSRSGRAIKLVLMDQSKIAGIGNIYSNDALFLAGVHPATPAKDLVPTQGRASPANAGKIKKLRQAIIKVLKDGIKYGGASENTYKHLDGLGGKYQDHFLVYQRDGEKCSQCGSLIKRIKLGGRGTFFCPKCQK